MYIYLVNDDYKEYKIYNKPLLANQSNDIIYYVHEEKLLILCIYV